MKELIITQVCRHYHTDISDLMGSKLATRQLYECRQVIMFFLRMYEDMKMQQIADTFGCTHSTVCHALRQITNLLEQDHFNTKLTTIKKRIYESK